MCGRYASSRRPEDLVEEFEVVDDRVEKPLEPDYNVAPTKEVYAVVERPPSKDSPEPPAAAAPGAPLGADPVVGQGPVDRQPDDQRPDGDGGREAGVQAGVRRASVPAAGRRLLRVVPDLAADQGGQAAQAAVLHPTRGRRGAGDGRSLRDLARPHPRRGRPAAVPLDLHRAHHRGRGRRRPHPRPDAADASSPSGGRPGSTRDTAGLSARPAGPGPAGQPGGLPGLDRWSATCATTAPSWSSRSRWRRPWSDRASCSSTRRTARVVWSPTRAHRPVATLLLSHGAGNGIEARDLEALAHYLPRNGVTVIRFEQPWRSSRSQGRDASRHPRRRHCWPRSTRLRVRTPLIVGGRSAGARSAARCAKRARGSRLPRAGVPAASSGPAREVPARRAARRRGADCWSSRASATRWAGRRSSRSAST